MAKILIIGAGVMGSALAATASLANDVTLIGTMLDVDIVRSLQENNHHPGLNCQLPGSISATLHTDSNERAYKEADIVVLGVSSPGVDWALNEIHRNHCRPNILALVTKGLVAGPVADSPPGTYAQYLDPGITSPPGRIVGIGGPCIARELAMNYPTHVSFASYDISAANELREKLQTDIYRITTDTDITGLEACAALKNFMCIGVSAMFSAHELENSYAKNPVAALFNQAVKEMAILSNWIVSSALPDSRNVSSSKSGPGNPFDLAGMGDLHVTVGGGRNSRLGRYLGAGETLQQIVRTSMRGVTVEGVDTGRQLAAGYHAACETGALDAHALPLTRAILDCIENDVPFNFNFKSLPD